jgi:hypothetical protein
LSESAKHIQAISTNRFGKGTASAVPPRANKDKGFSP